MDVIASKFNEIKYKISKIQNNYAMKMNFAHKEDLKVIASDNKWHKSDIFGEGIKFKAILQNNPIKNANIFLFHSLGGRVIDAHSHDEDQILICIEGQLRVVQNNNEHTILNKWESVHIKKNIMHTTEILKESLFISIWE